MAKIIFIPGLFCTNEVWGSLNSLRDEYSCMDADVCNYASISEMADAVSRAIIPFDQYILIGVSMGGYIALELATRRHSWINKLVLINTTSHSVDKTTIPDRLKAIEWAKQGNLESILNLAEGYCFFNKRQIFLALERKMAHEVGLKAYINQQRAIMDRRSYSASLDTISIPTLIISSREDQVLPYQDSLMMFEKIVHAELVLFSQCGHLSILEKSEEVNKLVRNFI